MHQGNEEEIGGRTEEGQRKRRPGIQRKEKKMEEKGLERLKRKQTGRSGNRSLYNKV